MDKTRLSLERRLFASSSRCIWRFILEFLREAVKFRRLFGDALILDRNEGEALRIECLRLAGLPLRSSC